MGTAVYIIIYLIIVGLILVFNHGAHKDEKQSELHASNRYQVAKDIEASLKNRS
jgi:hypothetical protein